MQDERSSPHTPEQEHILARNVMILIGYLIVMTFMLFFGVLDLYTYLGMIAVGYSALFYFRRRLLRNDDSADDEMQGEVAG